MNKLPYDTLQTPDGEYSYLFFQALTKLFKI
jgi:hypothetical protein